MNKLQPEYKRIKTIAPHCPECKKLLKGDGSMIFPWWCDCGTWKLKFDTNGNIYYIIKK